MYPQFILKLKSYKLQSQFSLNEQMYKLPHFIIYSSLHCIVFLLHKMKIQKLNKNNLKKKSLSH